MKIVKNYKNWPWSVCSNILQTTVVFTCKSMNLVTKVAFHFDTWIVPVVDMNRLLLYLSNHIFMQLICKITPHTKFFWAPKYYVRLYAPMGNRCQMMDLMVLKNTAFRGYVFTFFDSFKKVDWVFGKMYIFV